MWTRVLYALFAVYAAATALHIGYVMAHEPFTFDAWNVAFATRGEPATVGRFFDFWWAEYTHSNPRIGQALTYLAYKLDGFAEIATPLAYLAIATAVTILGLGRAPWRRARDLAPWAIAIGCGWFAFPELGRNMFCRAYGANYVYSAALVLWFLVPLRLARSSAVSTRAAIAYGLAGVVAGLCNEHTGPVLVAFLLGGAWWLRRRGEPARLWWAGGGGVVAGFLALFFSPGQAERYEGLATKVSIPVRVLQRGVINNLDIVRDYVAYAAPLGLLLVVLVVVAVRRRRDRDQLREPLRLVALALVAGLVMTVTLFASPKLGSRFYLVSMALLLAGVVAVIDAVFEPGDRRGRGRIPLVVLAVAASGYAAVRTVPVYVRAKAESDARLAQLATAPRGSTVVVDSFAQVPESWWFIGDDFRVAKKRERVAAYFGLHRVLFRENDADVPLGIGGARILARAWTQGAACPLDEPLDLAGLLPFDVPGMQASIRATAEALARDGIDRFEVTVDVPGLDADARAARPAGIEPIPARPLVLARWHAGKLETYGASIARSGVSTTREVRLGPALRGAPFTLYAAQVGSGAKRLGTTADAPLRYVPWRTGIYWILACDAADCWIVAAGRNHAL